MGSSNSCRSLICILKKKFTYFFCPIIAIHLANLQISAVGNRQAELLVIKIMGKCPQYIHYKRRSNTFVGSSPRQGNIFFLKFDLQWAFSYILIHLQWSNLIFMKLSLYSGNRRTYCKSIILMQGKNSCTSFIIIGL